MKQEKEFTKARVNEMRAAVTELFVAIPKKSRLEYVGHLTELAVFFERAEEVAQS